MQHSASEMGQEQPTGLPHDSRRSYELRSLYATARSLTALAELDEVLISIVRHAHDLMGSDITYLSTYDDVEDRFVLRAVEGSISQVFRTARVPAMTGVAARVAHTLSPAWVSNYLAAGDLHHDPNFDHVVEVEGIKALLGVPLLDGTVARGVLFAADRTERGFDPDEIALFSAFADHAAVSLRNARIYQESQNALRKLQEAYRTIEVHVTEIERAAQVHEALTEAVLSGGSSTDVINVLVKTLGGSAVILDRYEKVAAVVPEGDSVPEPDTGIKAAVSQARSTGRCIQVSQDGQRHLAAAAILAGDTYLGALLHGSEASLTAEEVRILERTAQILGLLILKQDAVADAQERARGELLAEILDSSKRISNETLERAATRRFSLETMNSLVCISTKDVPAQRVAHFLNLELPPSQGLVGERHNKIVMITKAASLSELASRLHVRLADSFHSRFIVCATPLNVLDEPRRSDLKAARCVDLLRVLGNDHKAAVTAELEAYSLVFDPARNQELAEFMDHSLGPLLKHDGLRRTELVRTLRLYFAEGGNLSRTAAGLYIHVNTLTKRIQRISALLGGDWISPPRSVSLELAIQMHQLMEQSPKESDPVPL